MVDVAFPARDTGGREGRATDRGCGGQGAGEGDAGCAQFGRAKLEGPAGGLSEMTGSTGNGPGLVTHVYIDVECYHAF